MDKKDDKNRDERFILHQDNILGINPNTGDLMITGDQLLGMKVTSLEETKNFLFGVNNFASQFSQNSVLLDSIANAENTILRIAPEIERANSIFSESNITGIKLFTENMTSVLAYGKAVQDQFSILTENPIFKDGITTLGKTKTQLDSILERSTIYTPPESIASPFSFYPREVITEEVIEKLPEVKKELPAKTTQAIELMEYVFDTDTKNNNKVITTTVAELKRAVKNMQGSISMFVQQTTHKVEIVSTPTIHTFAEKSTLHSNKFPFKIPAGTTWQNIIIQFINNDVVNIMIGGHSHQTGYADMGFVDKRTNKPTIQWGLLSVLAKNNGLLSASSGDAKDKYKKHKQLLSDKLKEYFDIDSDPFEPYKGGYKTKITLTPPQTKNTEPAKSYSLSDEVDDMFRDLTEE